MKIFDPAPSGAAKTLPIRSSPRGDWLHRFAGRIVIVFAVLTPWLIYAAGRAISTNSNELADWLPSHLPETRDLAQFDEWFGGGAFVVVSWDDCRVDTGREDASGDDPRLAKLTEILSPRPTHTGSGDDPHVREVREWSSAFDSAIDSRLGLPENIRRAEIPIPIECERYFKEIVTTRSLLEQLIAPPLSLTRDEAVRRLSGSVLGANGEACVIVTLTEAATRESRQAIGCRYPRWIERNDPQGALYRAVIASGIPLESAHFGGPPIDNLAINEEGQRTLARLALAAGGLGLALAWWSLRNITLTLIVFSCGIISTCGATAAIWVLGYHADAIVLAMPSLIYVLTISGAVHLVNYYRQEVFERGVFGAARRALVAGAAPAILCSVTTALGLLSLLASDLAPIRRFGGFSALGMFLMLLVLFLLLPASLEYFGRGTGFGWKRRNAFDEADDSDGAIERWAVLWARWVTRHCYSVCIVSLVAMIVLAAGLGRIQTSVDLLKLFDSKTRILADYQWLEANIGNLVPLEILIRFDQEALQAGEATSDDRKLTMLDRALVVQHVQRQIEQRFGEQGEQLLSPAFSAGTFLPSLPVHTRGTSGIIRRQLTLSKLEQSRAALMESGYLAVDPASGDEIWRISLRVAAFKNVDYGVFLDDIRSTVTPLVSKISSNVRSPFQPFADEPIIAIHTGAVPIVYKAQRALLESLIESTIWSFATITPLLMLVTRGVASGAVAMLPNLLPVLAVFGSMGWLGIPVDIGCMMTASIALGVAVDDTIHFLSWYRHAQCKSEVRSDAIEEAFRSCCRPTLQASLVNGLGLSVFLLSTFTPTRQFGLLMLVILTCGAVAELILLPAILASPIGRVFALPRRDKSGDVNEHDEEVVLVRDIPLPR